MFVVRCRVATNYFLEMPTRIVALRDFFCMYTCSLWILFWFGALSVTSETRRWRMHRQKQTFDLSTKWSRTTNKYAGSHNHEALIQSSHARTHKQLCPLPLRFSNAHRLSSERQSNRMRESSDIEQVQWYASLELRDASRNATDGYPSGMSNDTLCKLLVVFCQRTQQ